MTLPLTRFDSTELKAAGARVMRILGATVLILVAAPGSTALAQPDAGADSSSPYPDLRYFTEVDASDYTVPEQQGIWFQTNQGLDCVIWWRGSFLCRGQVPGAPPGVDNIGWMSGDRAVHYDPTVAIKFPRGHADRAIPALSYVQSEGTTCATTLDGGTYCERGPYRFLITSTHTWLNG